MNDILMRGINMPATGVYILSVDNTGTDKTIFTISTQTNSGKIIPRYVCEAVIVPPHGRLIDADEFLGTIRPIAYDDADYVCDLFSVKTMVYEHINNAPTVIPASEEAENG